MPLIGTLPPRHPKSSGADAIGELLGKISQIKQQRSQRQLTSGLLSIIASGGDSQDISGYLSGQDVSLAGQTFTRPGAKAYPSGIAGFLPRLFDTINPMASAQMGSTSLESAIMGQMLKSTLDPTADLRTEALRERIETSKFRRQPKPTKPPKGFTLNEATKIRSQIGEIEIEKRDIPGWGKGQKKNVLFQEDILKRYIESVSQLNLNPAQRKHFDKMWDIQMRRRQTPREQKDKTGNIIKVGWNPKSPEVREARKQLQTAPASQMQTQPKGQTMPFAESVKAQSAPATELDAVWPKLTVEQKEKVWAAFEKGIPPEEIIEALKTDGVM